MNAIRLFWLALGAISVVLAVIGIVLPLLPTTPFLILAAFAFSKSSPRLERWLVDHPRFGPSIRDWRKERAIGRKPKWLASVMMAVLLVAGFVARLPILVLAAQAGVFVLVLAFLWTRPEPSR